MTAPLRHPVAAADALTVFKARAGARVLLWLAGEIDLHEVIPADEYEGLSSTFAAACRKVNEKQRHKPIDQRIKRLQRLLEDDVTLEQAWAEINRPKHVAASTLQAADQLVREDDNRLHKWLARHSAQERAAIVQYFERKKARHETSRRA